MENKLEKNYAAEYKKQILKMLEEIHGEKLLCQIYTIIKNMEKRKPGAWASGLTLVFNFLR